MAHRLQARPMGEVNDGADWVQGRGVNDMNLNDEILLIAVGAFVIFRLFVVIVGRYS